MRPLARLGEIMRLNGAVPRGLDLRGAVPRRCALCGALVIVPGKGRARARYCAACRATRCRSCRHVGSGHYPYCSTLTPRPCRGCGVELGHGGPGTLYCAACHAQCCPECHAFAGRHRAPCRYAQRRRRPALTERVDVVSVDHLLALYEAQHAAGVRLAQSICGAAHAADVVQDVFVYLLARREYLSRPPGKAYFLRAVRHGALRVRRAAWMRYRVAMDPGALLLAEQAMFGKIIW